jgi:hypothetical protein
MVLVSKWLKFGLIGMDIFCTWHRRPTGNDKKITIIRVGNI